MLSIYNTTDDIIAKSASKLSNLSPQASPKLTASKGKFKKTTSIITNLENSLAQNQISGHEDLN